MEIKWDKIEKDYSKGLGLLLAWTIKYKRTENSFLKKHSFVWYLEHDFNRRDLFDFFDQQKICINIIRDGYDDWEYTIEWVDKMLDSHWDTTVEWKDRMNVYTEYDPDDNYKTREGAENKSWKKAFEILERRLNG